MSRRYLNRHYIFYNIILWFYLYSKKLKRWKIQKLVLISIFFRETLLVVKFSIIRTEDNFEPQKEQKKTKTARAMINKMANYSFHIKQSERGKKDMFLVCISLYVSIEVWSWVKSIFKSLKYRDCCQACCQISYIVSSRVETPPL